MFSDPGKTIKEFSKILCILLIAVCMTIGGIFLVDGMTLTGLLIIIGGSLGVYVSCLLLYAFGELVEDTHAIAESSTYIADNLDFSKQK